MMIMVQKRGENGGRHPAVVAFVVQGGGLLLSAVLSGAVSKRGTRERPLAPMAPPIPLYETSGVLGIGPALFIVVCTRYCLACQSALPPFFGV